MWYKFLGQVIGKIMGRYLIRVGYLKSGVGLFVPELPRGTPPKLGANQCQ